MAEKKTDIREEVNVPREGERAEEIRTEGNDAVCFTAGLAGTAFGAGTIHAYLAADRDPPKVAAGISMGALNAAAMQRVYRELLESASKKDPAKVTEAARWRWFRQYVEALADRPLNVFWDAIPDQSDFFADMVPIHDTSAPASLKNAERKARRRRYLLVRLGQWLAKLPVKVGLVASLIVNYVRVREQYPFTPKLQSVGNLLRGGVTLITQVITHAVISPQHFPEHKFVKPPAPPPPREPWAVPLPPRWGLSFLAWQNLFNFTLAVLFWAMALAFSIGVSLPEEKEGKYLELGGWVAGALAGWMILGRTKRFQHAVMNVWLVRNWGLPAFGWVVYMLSWLSLLPLAGVAGFGFLAWLEFLQRKDYAREMPLLLGFFAMLVIPFVLLAMLVLIPELRRWMIEHGFLQQWKRPLFGWPVYVFVCVHLAGLLCYLVLGTHYVALAGMTRGVVFDARLAALGMQRLLLIPLVAIAAIFALRLVRGWLVREGYLRSSQKPRVAWVGFWLLAAVAVYDAGRGFQYLLQRFTTYVDPRLLPPHFHLWEEFLLAAWVLFVTWIVIFGVLLIPELGYPAFGHVLGQLGLRRGLVHDYHLRRKLMQLFDPNWKKSTAKEKPTVVRLKEKPVRVLLVAAPLPTLKENNQPLPSFQVWARPETPLIDALRTALAAPPILEPVRLKSKAQLGWWLKGTVQAEWMNTKHFKKRKGLDLVDGGVIRENPLPALFSYLRGNQKLAQEMAGNNDEQHAAIHVVYRVPLEGRPVPPPVKPDLHQKQEKVPVFNIVDVAKLSLRLSARRDTQLEVEQTNAISRMEQAIQEADGPPGTGKNFCSRIFADEIAPEEDLVFENPLNPSPQEILTAVAAGCRGTLETLYKDELTSFDGTSPQVHCPALLVSIAKPRRVDFLSPEPGLPEVCLHCTQMLKRPKEKKGEDARHSTLLVADALESSKKLVTSMPWLSGEQPRIVFVASGGVFRGAFHIGMLAALRECRIKPDLIVGASVGTLMGGALGAMFMPPKDGPDQEDVLTKLVRTFLFVDERVALTKRLKGAARELGLRGRDIHLSPGNVRRMVLRGSRSDPGFAAAGAPTPLIDAISNLFMIPYRETADIAAEFVAGHVTQAMNLFLQQLKEETLERLDIERAVIGTSLLEPVARDLLGATGLVLTERQPFKTKKIAFYGTTTNLVTQAPMLLGGNRERADAPYDYVEAALASSAFPAVFAPRQESGVFPGSGRADIFFSDGGMFDNLPFLPAIEILSRGQDGYRRTWGKHVTALDFLKQRNKSPDLLIVGALNALPEKEPEAAGPFDSLAAIHKRAKSLENNVKIRSFEFAAKRIHDQLGRFVAGTARPHPADTKDLHPADGMVDAAVLPVFPASPEHLNGTFAFCASTGLEAGRVRKSIADGCYQTLLAFAEQQNGSGLTAESVRGLRAARKIPTIERLGKKSGKKEGVTLGRCPFFKWSYPQQSGPAVPHVCPFAQGGGGAPGWGVYAACGKDSAHAKA